MKFIYLTDIHIRKSTPVSRNDVYVDTLFKKLEYVLEYAKRKSVDIIIFGGDLLDVPSPCDEVVEQFISLIKKYHIPWYAIYGNHENKIPVKKGKLGLLQHCRLWHHLQKPVIFEDVVLVGIDYEKKSECMTSAKLDIDENLLKNKFSICVLHTMIGKENLIVKGVPKICSYKNFELYPKFDMILTGHYHPGYGVKRVTALSAATTFANPGSVMRLGVADAAQTIGPGFAYGVITGKALTTVKHVIIPHSTDVFNIEAGVVRLKDKKLRQSFISVLQSFREHDMDGGNILQKFDKMIKHLPEELAKQVSDKLVKEIRERLTNELGTGS